MKKSKAVRGSFILGLALVLVLLGWAIDHTNEQEALRSGRAPVSLLSALGGSPHSERIGNGSISVKADSYAYFTLALPPGATGASLRGHFVAQGGSGNDIEVYVLSEDQFANWKNGHQTPTYYNSKKVTAGDVSISLPDGAGTYYLVFNNNFSLLTPKAVQEKFTLSYLQ